MADTGPSSVLWSLKREEELRLEIPENETCTVTLASGTAELFGTELAVERAYLLKDRQCAIFSWYGAQIVISAGSKCHIYIGKETPMAQYLQTHATLERHRIEPLQTRSQKIDIQSNENSKNENTEGINWKEGPRVMVVGPQDTGKSTVCSILTNYAVRGGKIPLFMDLDVGQNCIMPGTVSAVRVHQPIDIEQGFESFSPNTYYYGYTSPSAHVDIYKHAVDKLIHSCEEMSRAQHIVGQSGWIVNTCGWVDPGDGFRLLLDLIRKLVPDFILVLDSERLYSDLTTEVRKMEKEGTLGNISSAVVRLPKSGGVVTRDVGTRDRMVHQKIRNYFYGPPTMKDRLNPIRIVKRDFPLYMVGMPMAPEDALPVGAERSVDPTIVTKVEMNESHVHSVIALTDSEQPENALSACVRGYVHVILNEHHGNLEFLAPCAGPWPGSFGLLGSIVWIDG